MHYLAKAPAIRWAGTVLLAVLASAAAAGPTMPSQTDRAFAGATRSAEAPLRSDLAGTRIAQSQTPAAQTPHETAEASLRTFRDCSDCPEMVEIPAGRFMMGSTDGDNDEKPAHEVTIAKPFAIGKFLVTFDEWDACAVDGGCRPNVKPDDYGWGRGRRPVINISWNDAQTYVMWLSAKTGKPYRLLSEAEWEYAARAGTTTKFAFGDTITHEQAQFSYGKLGAGQTVEVGKFAPNAWGLYDMHGNVWEWVQDCYFINYIPAPADGSAFDPPPGCNQRVLRGGSWDYEPNDIRSAARYKLLAGRRLEETGLRVARSLE
jgi:formylglycine-generating enzyme required for sulfatase activity